MEPRTDSDPLLDVRNLQTHFVTRFLTVRAVDGVSWSVARGRTLALVGETGCGKTATALSVLRLVPSPPGRMVGGSILLRDDPSGPAVDVLRVPERRMRSIRGARIAMIFQEPASSLNPVLTVGEQIAEVVRAHRGLGRRDAWDLARDMLCRVGIPDAQRALRAYPHQMSGGMQQRVMIAIAIACAPALLIADEPTSALDVTVQAGILDLLRRLQAETGMAIVLITHDLGIVAQVADHVCVMYAGRVVEQAATRELFEQPLHPYTRGLLRCVPRLSDPRHRLDVIPGSVAGAVPPAAGCSFHPRCDLSARAAAAANRQSVLAETAGRSVRVLRRCVQPTDDEPGGRPELRELRPNHYVACWEAQA